MTTDQPNTAQRLSSGPESSWRKLMSWAQKKYRAMGVQPTAKHDNAEVFKWVKRALDDAGSDNSVPLDLRVRSYRASHLIADAGLDGPILSEEPETKERISGIVQVLQDIGQHHALTGNRMAVSYVSRIRSDLADHAGVRSYNAVSRALERSTFGL
ncbi:MAG: hypothetical protein AAF213_07735 [Pseudomonadota bacterium]